MLALLLFARMKVSGHGWEQYVTLNWINCAYYLWSEEVFYYVKLLGISLLQNKNQCLV